MSWSLNTPNVLRPNAVVGQSTMTMMATLQIIFTLALWTVYPSAIVPKPLDIFNAFGPIWENGFGQEMITSFTLCLEATFFTIILSLALSYLTVVPFFRPIAAFVSKGRFLGTVGFTFLFTLITSSGHELKLLLLVFSMTVFFVTSMTAVVANIPKAEFDYARTLRMSEWRVVFEVVVLGRFSEAIEVLQQNFAIGWMMLTMVEGVSRSEGGVGKFLLDSNKHFELAEIFAIQITIFVVGLCMDYAYGKLNRAICPYAFISRERA